MKNVKNFVSEQKITVSNIQYVSKSPHKIAFLSWNANHYKVTLKNGTNKKQMSLYFSMGIGEPTANDIINCLQSDSYTYLNNEKFEDFCCNFGYESYEKRNKKLYNTILRQSKRFEKFLGEEQLKKLAFEYEGL